MVADENNNILFRSLTTTLYAVCPGKAGMEKVTVGKQDFPRWSFLLIVNCCP